MTGSEPAQQQTYVLTGVWHIVRAGPLAGPKVGPFYVFWCWRWAASSKALGIAHGRPTGPQAVCIKCEANEGIARTSGTGPSAPSSGPDDGEEP